MKQRIGLLMVAVAVGMALLGAGRAAAAPLTCDVVTATECRITTLHNLGAGGTFTVDRTLHIFGPPAELRTNPGSTLDLSITGDLIMEVGGKITGNAFTGSGVGATINITASGKILLAGSVTGGAQITADQLAGSCSGGGGGNITIVSNLSDFPNASIITEAGSVISANAKCSGGAISISAPNKGKIEIGGVVESASTLTGTGAVQRPGGGPITVTAACDLSILDTGVVSSRGSDPGADLVHLQGGCNVLILGLVESTGPGHTVPNSPPNHCATAPRLDKPANSTACVEVWAGDSLLIDGRAPKHGEINADTAQTGGHQIAWIDLFARGPIQILDEGTGPFKAKGVARYVVHANEFVSNSDGGIITVKSRAGSVTTSGRAIQADGGLSTLTGVPTLGGAGGTITVEAGGTPSGSDPAAGDVDFGASSIRARGATSGGGHQAGGHIAARSFNGKVLGAAPGELNASGGGVAGSVTLRGCGSPAAGDGVSYTGTSTPAKTVLPDLCGGAPLLPLEVTPGDGKSYVTLPDCPCAAGCVGPDCCPNPPCNPCVPPDCCPNPPCIPDTGWCEKGSVKLALNPLTGNFPLNLGPDVIVDARTTSIQSVIDSALLSDSNGDGYIIVGVIANDGGLPGGTVMQIINVSKFYPKPFALIACGVTLKDPDTCDNIGPVVISASGGSPGFPSPLGSSINLYIQDFTATNSFSAPGWLVEGNGRYLESAGATGDMIGIKVVGDGNVIHTGFANRNLLQGFLVQGNGNTIDGVEALKNGLQGIQVTGDNNQVLNSLAGDAGLGNNKDGINVSGKGNLVRGNSAFANQINGIAVSGGVAGSPNVVKGNQAGDVGKGNNINGLEINGSGNGAAAPVEIEGNTTKSNGKAGIKVRSGTDNQLKDNVSGGVTAAEDNGECEYRTVPGNIDAGGNVTNGVSGPVLIGGCTGTP